MCFAENRIYSTLQHIEAQISLLSAVQKLMQQQSNKCRENSAYLTSDFLDDKPSAIDL